MATIEPDTLTDHTDVICSTSIERIVKSRNTALSQIEALIHQLDRISLMTFSVGGGINLQTRRECCFCFMGDLSLTTVAIYLSD